MTPTPYSHGCTPTAQPSARYRKVLWVALLVNAAMFAVELAGGLSAASVSLLADARWTSLVMRSTTACRCWCWAWRRCGGLGPHG